MRRGSNGPREPECARLVVIFWMTLLCEIVSRSFPGLRKSRAKSSGTGAIPLKPENTLRRNGWALCHALSLSLGSIPFSTETTRGPRHKTWNEYLKQFIFISFSHEPRPMEEIGKLQKPEKRGKSFPCHINFIFIQKYSREPFFAIPIPSSKLTWMCTFERWQLCLMLLRNTM